MDITQYQKDRASELRAFKEEYTELKNKYKLLLNQAIFDERDDLVQEILDVNTQIAAHVRNFIAQAGNKFDPQTISDLTSEIIRYQTEYAELKASRDKKKTFTTILNKQSEKLSKATDEFNFFLAILLGGIVFIVMLIFVTPSTPLIPSEDFLSPSTSMSEMGTTVGGMMRALSRKL
jgi:hypothetical protein